MEQPGIRQKCNWIREVEVRGGKRKTWSLFRRSNRFTALGEYVLCVQEWAKPESVFFLLVYVKELSPAWATVAGRAGDLMALQVQPAQGRMESNRRGGERVRKRVAVGPIGT